VKCGDDMYNAKNEFRQPDSMTISDPMSKASVGAGGPRDCGSAWDRFQDVLAFVSLPGAARAVPSY
jgi:hypothetical protein